MSSYQELQNTLDLFASTFYEAAAGMVQVKMPEGRFLRANKKMCAMLDYTEEEFCTKTILDVTHPDDVQLDLDKTRQILNGEVDIFSLEKRLLKKDGASIWVRLTATSVVHDEHGQPKYGMAVIEDLSQAKLTEEHLQESERRFQVLADSAPVFIFVMDTEPKVIYVNRSWLEYTGQSSEKALGAGKLKSAIHPDDVDAFDQVFLDAYYQQKPFRFETRVRKANGEYGWVLASGVPRYTPAGLFLGYIGTGIDITEQKGVEVALEAARALAEESNKRKSEFLSLISHELRTPLNSIIGFSELLEMQSVGALNNTQQEYVHQVITSGYHLLHLVDDILDVAKIEAGKMTIYPRQTDINALLEDVQHMMLELANKKEVKLSFQLQPELDQVYADPQRLKQIFINLIDNAIKFNKPGGLVTVRMNQSQDTDWLESEVYDTGIGIPESKIPQLFQKFYQVDSSLTRVHGGSGLGLVLTKELIEMHGGSIQVESKEGIGTSFRFRIPSSLAIVPEPAPQISTERF